METQYNQLEESMEYMILTTNNSSAAGFCNWDFNGKNAVFCNGLNDQEIARSYWLLKKNAHGIPQEVPIPMCLEAILGGYVILMTMNQKMVDSGLVLDLKAQCLETTPISFGEDITHYKNLVPIGYIDFYHKGKRKFGVGDLGIAKPYQGKGLSKLLISAGTELVGARQLIIPIPMGNAIAHYAWLHFSPLEIISAGTPHIKGLDNMIYKAKVSDLKIKGSVKGAKLLKFSMVKGYYESHPNAKVVGYKAGDNGGLYVE